MRLVIQQKWKILAIQTSLPSSLLLLISSVKHRMFQQGLEKWSFQILPAFIVVEERSKPFVVSWNMWAQNIELVVLVFLTFCGQKCFCCNWEGISWRSRETVQSDLLFTLVHCIWKFILGQPHAIWASPSVESSAFDLWWNCWQSWKFLPCHRHGSSCEAAILFLPVGLTSYFNNSAWIRCPW